MEFVVVGFIVRGLGWGVQRLHRYSQGSPKGNQRSLIRGKPDRTNELLPHMDCVVLYVHIEFRAHGVTL
jgi:hypothetical protein